MCSGRNREAQASGSEKYKMVETGIYVHFIGGSDLEAEESTVRLGQMLDVTLTGDSSPSRNTAPSVLTSLNAR